MLGIGSNFFWARGGCQWPSLRPETIYNVSESQSSTGRSCLGVEHASTTVEGVDKHEGPICFCIACDWTRKQGQEKTASAKGKTFFDCKVGQSPDLMLASEDLFAWSHYLT